MNPVSGYLPCEGSAFFLGWSAQQNRRYLSWIIGNSSWSDLAEKFVSIGEYGGCPSRMQEDYGIIRPKSPLPYMTD